MNKNGERHARILSSNSIEILQTTSDLVAVRRSQIFENILGIVVLSEGTMYCRPFLPS
jgi:hypothetical protein